MVKDILGLICASARAPEHSLSTGSSEQRPGPLNCGSSDVTWLKAGADSKFDHQSTGMFTMIRPLVRTSGPRIPFRTAVWLIAGLLENGSPLCGLGVQERLRSHRW